MSAVTGIASVLPRPLRRLLQESPTAQRAYRRYLHRRQSACAPQWDRLLQRNGELWRRARHSARTGSRVLIATTTGAHPSAPLMESLLAVALTLRGADVHFLLCDSFLPACMIAETRLMAPAEFARAGPQGYFCNGCFQHANSMYAPLGLPVHRFSEFISREDVGEAAKVSSTMPCAGIRTYVADGLAVGEHAVAGTLRYFARADVTGQSNAEAVLRRYLDAAIQTSFVMRNLLKAHPFASVCLNHALYVPQGIVAEAARAAGCRVSAWNVAYRKQSFIFSHGETYHHTLMNESTSIWEDLPWDAARERETMDYLESRRGSGRDWIAFHAKNPDENLASILETLGVDRGRPVIGMLTNVAWDAQLHYPANAFRDMLTWVRETVAYFAKRTDLQLVIRVHPAEVTGGILSRQPVVEEIRRAFPAIPDNVRIIPPDSGISTYAVMEPCNAVLIYGTKTGVELTSRGTPVIVAGEAWIRNKGVTIDADSAEDYFRILDQLPFVERMSEGAITRARKYAYHFFFRRMIPLTQVAPTGLKEPAFQIDVSRLEDLTAGRSRGLDLICDGILKGTPFVYPAEESGFSKDGR